MTHLRFEKKSSLYHKRRYKPPTRHNVAFLLRLLRYSGMSDGISAAVRMSALQAIVTCKKGFILFP